MAIENQLQEVKGAQISSVLKGLPEFLSPQCHLLLGFVCLLFANDTSKAYSLSTLFRLNSERK